MKLKLASLPSLPISFLRKPFLNTLLQAGALFCAPWSLSSLVGAQEAEAPSQAGESTASPKPEPAAVAAAAPSAPAPLQFEIDPVHSDITFRIRHLVARTSGRFDEFSGTITCDPQHPETSSVSVTIQSRSINTKMNKRDEHLRNADFFDCDRFKTIDFRSDSFQCTAGDATQVLPTNEYKLAGRLTLLGKTQPVELNVKELRFGTDSSGKTVLGCEATTTISRKQFGLGYGPMEDTVAVEISIEALSQSPEAPAAALSPKTAPSGQPEPHSSS